MKMRFELPLHTANNGFRLPGGASHLNRLIAYFSLLRKVVGGEFQVKTAAGCASTR